MLRGKFNRSLELAYLESIVLRLIQETKSQHFADVLENSNNSTENPMSPHPVPSTTPSEINTNNKRTRTHENETISFSNETPQQRSKTRVSIAYLL